VCIDKPPSLKSQTIPTLDGSDGESFPLSGTRTRRVRNGRSEHGAISTSATDIIYVAFQMAEVAIPRNLFADILRLIAELRPSWGSLGMHRRSADKSLNQKSNHSA
jgi:hypothetical protein